MIKLHNLSPTRIFFAFFLGAEPIRAGTALDVVKYQAKLKHPERILATNLRKHTATISQVSSKNVLGLITSLGM